MGREIDFSALVAALHHYRARPGTQRDALAVCSAMIHLRRTGFPECYLDGLEDELMRMACDRVPDAVKSFVYLAFHGDDGKASHMKIGVAKSVRKRMAALYTGSPLPRLWVFRAEFVSRSQATRVERALLGHMAKARNTGEWISLGSVSEGVAAEIANSLGEVASLHVSHPVAFELAEF